MISLANEDRVNDVVLSAVLGLWDVVNNLTQLRPSRRDRYRVTIFGSARAQPGSFGYEETKRAATVLAAMGCDIITGGGPGLMQAANEGGPRPRPTGPGRSASGSSCPSSRTSMPSSPRPSATAPSSRACTSS
jgi:hypothetical protein